MSYEQASLVLRVLAAIVWTVLLGVRMHQHNGRSVILRLRLVDLVLAGVLWAFVYGGLVGIGAVPGDAAKVVYTGVATMGLIVGLVLLTMRREL